MFITNSKKSGKVKTAYKREYVNLGCDVDFDFAGPTIHGAAVVGYEGWLAGYQMSFDTAKSKMTQNNFAIGYKTGDFQLHTNVWVSKNISFFFFFNFFVSIDLSVFMLVFKGKQFLRSVMWPYFPSFLK